jgi:hypothetical protein
VKKLRSTPFTVFHADVLQSLAQNADYCVQYVIDLFKAKFKGTFAIPLVTEVTNAEEVEKIVNFVVTHC